MNDYTEGLFYSCIAVVIFGAFGWIEVGTELGKFTSLFLVAIIFWTITYYTYELMYIFISFLAAFTFGIGAIIACIYIASWLVKITAYLLSPNIVTFTNDNGQLFIIGVCYCLMAWTVTDVSIEDGDVDSSVENES